jgi:hypothetical protein
MLPRAQQVNDASGKGGIGQEAITVFSSTATPSDRTPTRREVKHTPTVISSTETWTFTVFPYTAATANWTKSLRIPAANCTKLSFKLYNSGVDVFWAETGAVR